MFVSAVVKSTTHFGHDWRAIRLKDLIFQISVGIIRPHRDDKAAPDQCCNLGLRDCVVNTRVCQHCGNFAAIRRHDVNCKLSIGRCPLTICIKNNDTVAVFQQGRFLQSATSKICGNLIELGCYCVQLGKSHKFAHATRIGQSCMNSNIGE